MIYDTIYQDTHTHNQYHIISMDTNTNREKVLKRDANYATSGKGREYLDWDVKNAKKIFNTMSYDG